MWGIRKKRSKLGKWLDKKGIPQKELEKATQLNKNTISRACNDSNYIPSERVIKKILKAVKRVDSKIKMSNFWDM
ncbi:helix-turn-helix domain-containing protein [Bacillus wiedmannii]|uniref:helix-turn-helix domain-containing protein n=1 Tax=Bacillus wiedmannii TaxID=1890302 RepID=UPI000BEC1AB7|nr:helix-turn-helix transcriptional regulator [Bacillus wiedmannii]PEF40003.1 transcriptional regulator [Bacillus wiedmannii]